MKLKIAKKINFQVVVLNVNVMTVSLDMKYLIVISVLVQMIVRLKNYKKVEMVKIVSVQNVKKEKKSSIKAVKHVLQSA